MIRGLFLLLALIVAAPTALAKSEITETNGHFSLQVDGAPFFVKGVTWRPPSTFAEDPAAFWQQSDKAIKAQLSREVPLLKQAGINTLRFTTAPPAKWIDVLHQQHGLSSVLTIHAAAVAEQRKAVVDRYKKSKGLLAWVVIGLPADDSVVTQIEEADQEHAIGLYSEQLADLTQPGAAISGFDFFVIPSLEGAHQDAFARARSHLKRPLLLWSLALESGGVGEAQPKQWEAIYRHAVGTGMRGTALGAFTPQWCGEGALCTRKKGDDGVLVVEAGPALDKLGEVHSFDVFSDTADAAAVTSHFAGLTPAPAPEPEPLPAPKPEPPPQSGGNEKVTVNRVKVHHDAKGFTLRVDGRDLLVKGMNWGYIPIGENYGYDLWKKSDAFIEKALADEMPLLKKMGVNAIRQYDSIPPRWVKYIYETYGIYTMVNHLVGRYGFIVNGSFRGSTDYADPDTRKAIKESVAASIKRFKDTPGVLLWLLGNENNYGLSWTSSEIEDLPDGDSDVARASHLYSLYAELIDIVHKLDANHPVAIANGDVQYIDVMARYCKELDIFGTNVYRGKSVRDMFEVVRDKLGIPVMFTEFGADAYDAKEDREDHLAQAEYLKAQWKEIYEQSYGHGGVGNAIGGFVFQWVDGWWKYKQETNLDVHDTNASWATGAYDHDFVDGANNMNEEWFGICAKGEPEPSGHFPVYPRAAYYVLRDVFELDPYAASTDQQAIDEHFAEIEPYDYDQDYKRALSAERARVIDKVRLYDVGIRFETFTTGGKRLADPSLGQDTRFDHLESFFIGAEVLPVRRFVGRVSFNIVGNVPTNPLNEIFYEARGRGQTLTDDTGRAIDLSGLERVAVYRSSLEWDEPWFNVEGYYRTGHYHWIDEGDFFNLYREANYGHWIDTYNGQAPFGMAFTGKRAIEGLRIAAGPQLYWGANPAVIGMYSRSFGDFRFTVMHQEDIVEQESATTSARIPEPKSRKSTLSMRWKSGRYQVDAGGIVAGSNHIEREFVGVREGTGVTYADSGFHVVEDEIRPVDTLGGKARFTADWSPAKVYLQGGYKGLVANAGPDEMPNVAGWTLREAGRGNHYHAVGGVLFQLGDFQVAPNFLYQRPIEGPLPNIDDLYASGSGNYYPGVSPRNVRESPFAVLENRETIGLEMVLGYDPTPGTWMWLWDNDRREDADFASNLDFVYRIQPTSRDSGIGFSATGEPLIFGAAPPARNAWDVTSRSIMNLPADVRIKLTLYAGQGQGNAGGTAVLDRTILRGGGDVRLTWDQLAIQGGLKLSDWGPYDYHRDFNITFPMQMMADTSYAVNTSEWLVDFYSRFGVRYMMRMLDEFSVPVAEGPDDGYVWEVRTYMHVGL